MVNCKAVVARAIAVGIISALGLFAFYLGFIGIISRDWQHALQLLLDDRLYIAAIAGGFGVQAGLFSYVRRLQKISRIRGAVAMTASGTGTSTVSMAACCLHHVGDFAPVLGASGAAIFLNEYRYPVMGVGILVNLLGIFLMLRLITRNRLWPSQVWRTVAREES